MPWAVGKEGLGKESITHAFGGAKGIYQPEITNRQKQANRDIQL
jgi:hypothetical protein